MSITDPNCLQIHFSRLLNKVGSELDVPPPKLFFWKWILRKLKNSKSEQLIFFDCYITQEFICEFSKVLQELNDRTSYQVKQLIFHGCHFQNLKADQFYKLIFELINAKDYIFSCISGCSNQLLQFDNISKFHAAKIARQIHFFGIRGEMATLLFNGPTDEKLLPLIFSEKPKFPHLNSLQFPAHNLSKEFVNKIISVC